MSADTLPLTGLVKGKVNPNVLVCGDPGRASRIAEHLVAPQLLSDRREYRAYNGRYQDTEITVCSHGIGSPAAAIAFEELVTAGGRALIRVGTCGSLQPDINVGCLIVATAAVQSTGYGREAAPAGYPAVADVDLSRALRHFAGQGEHPTQSGIVLSRDSFYPGVETSRPPDYQVMSAANVLAVEMECAALFIVGSLRGVRTAAILAVDGNVLAARESMDTYAPRVKRVEAAVDAEIQIALRALNEWQESSWSAGI